MPLSCNVDLLPLPLRQRDLLKRIAPVWTKMKSKSEGLNIFICASNMKVGLMTAEALAESCGMRVRKFPLKQLLGSSVAEDDKRDRPNYPKKMSPLDYAFAGTVGEACMTLFSDDEGEFETVLGSIKIPMLPKISSCLTSSQNFAAIMALPVPYRGGSPEKNTFRVSSESHPGYPPAETQVREWENHFGKGSVSDEDLVKLVERYPMHVAEIDEIAQRAWISAFMRKAKGKIDLSMSTKRLSSTDFQMIPPCFSGKNRDCLSQLCR